MPALQLLPASITVPIPATGLELVHSDVSNCTSEQLPSSLPPNNSQQIDQNRPAPSIFGSVLVYSMTRSVPWNGDDQTTDDYNRSWPHSQSRLIAYGHKRTCQPLDAAEHLQTTSGTQADSLHMLIQALHAHIPPSVDTTQAMRAQHFEQMIHQYHLKQADYWLGFPPRSISALLAAPKSTIWALYLSAWLFQAVDGNMDSTMVSRYIKWLDKLEQEFGCACRINSSLGNVVSWLNTQLTVVFIKFTTVGSSSGYLALQKALPAFLRLVADDSSLHVEHPGGDLVTSFPRTLGTPQYILQRFVLYDTIASLLLATSPLVEYGYEGECDPASHSLEWVHGIPVAFIGIISQVNSWRAGSRFASLADWQELEMRVLGWRSQPAPTEGERCIDTRIKLAIQEGWRHVTLIYIYMGMCGVSSHDERVQESISEIIRLGDAMDNLPIGVHILPHCVIVGLAAKYEKHRAIIHKKLLSFKGNRVWLFHGLDFARILEHLWYGVGAGGAPITWDDYVQSRRAVVPGI
ncbi:hypothetical protein RSOLAG22IIIB_07967 [Rhizoctonia solani]|uniref:Uncharacterized protein n=1 Tax=Rhizoctonia solani TaxID=456999 RepID=A0A0K6FQX1_9AGAM|nr:hypothetical protein RSOLAG22IIIB_07967 [Rhizoctonia solani]